MKHIKKFNESDESFKSKSYLDEVNKGNILDILKMIEENIDYII